MSRPNKRRRSSRRDSTAPTTSRWTDIVLSPRSGSRNDPITSRTGRQLSSGCPRDGTTTNTGSRCLPTLGAKPCRTTAIAMEREEGWTRRFVRTSDRTMRRIGVQGRPRTSGISTIFGVWRRGLPASTKLEERRGAREIGRRRHRARCLSRRNLMNEAESRGMQPVCRLMRSNGSTDWLPKGCIARSTEAITRTTIRPFGTPWRAFLRLAHKSRPGVERIERWRCREWGTSPRTGSKCINRKSARGSLCGVMLRFPISCTSTYREN